MKKILPLILISVCLLGLCACGASQPAAPLIGDSVTEAVVTHSLYGKDRSWTVTGEEIRLLREWAEGLKYRYVEFKPGNTPGDQCGGEAYSFEPTADEHDGGWPGFSYVKNGASGCWLLIAGSWFSVSNPSDPPVSEPGTAPGGRIEDVYYTAPKLTLDMLKWLVELRGEDLSWSDFMLYPCEEIGSGLCILRYPIDDTLCLVIGGTSPDIEPAYIRLAAVGEDGFITDNYIDPRTEDIDDFTNSLSK